MARHTTLVFLTLLILLAVPISSSCIGDSTPTITVILRIKLPNNYYAFHSYKNLNS